MSHEPETRRAGIPTSPAGSGEGAGVARRPAVFSTDDDTRLHGTWFQPADASTRPTGVIVIACGAGIPARFYHRLADYLAGRGAAVLTFDYRGIGESRLGSVREVDAGMDHWAVLDIGAALQEARARYPAERISAVAHSVGTLLLGAAPGAADLSRAVFLAPHTGYWGDYGARWRAPLYLTWHVLMPALTRLVGYFPGRALRLGEDLPAQVAMDWAGRRRKSLIRTPSDERRFAPSMFRYGHFRAPTLAMTFTDDAFAPVAAAHTLLAMYPGLEATREILSPAELGCSRLGHFGFFRRGVREKVWPRIAAWLIDEVIADCDAPVHAVAE